jgi:hypothetical protein
LPHLFLPDDENIRVSSHQYVSIETISCGHSLPYLVHRFMVFRPFARKARRATPSQPTPPQPQSFILEPILTPSGLVGTDDQTDDTTSVDWIHHPVMDVHATLDAHLVDMPDVVPFHFVDAVASTTSHAPDSPFTSGVFTVGDSGQVEVEYLWDGGGYKGDLAFFSLDGMDQLSRGRLSLFMRRRDGL